MRLLDSYCEESLIKPLFNRLKTANKNVVETKNIEIHSYKHNVADGPLLKTRPGSIVSFKIEFRGRDIVFLRQSPRQKSAPIPMPATVFRGRATSSMFKMIKH